MKPTQIPDPRLDDVPERDPSVADVLLELGATAIALALPFPVVLALAGASALLPP